MMIPKILTVLINIRIFANDIAFAVREFSACYSLVKIMFQLGYVVPINLVGHRESVDRRHVSFCRMLSKLELDFQSVKNLFKNLRKNVHQLLEVHFYSAQADVERALVRFLSV